MMKNRYSKSLMLHLQSIYDFTPTIKTVHCQISNKISHAYPKTNWAPNPTNPMATSRPPLRSSPPHVAKKRLVIHVNKIIRDNKTGIVS